MVSSMSAVRWVSLGLFLVLTLPVLTFLSLTWGAFAWLWFADTAVRAIPLCAW